jgi:ABC-type uncharacterized transport system substrate-binding protein
MRKGRPPPWYTDRLHPRARTLEIPAAVADSSDIPDGFRHEGTLVAKILSGSRPGDLPIEQASKFTLVINLKTAKSLGTFLSLADEVIE